MIKQHNHMSISTRLFITTGLVFVVAAIIVVALVNYHMRQQALVEAESKANILLERNLATHTYFSHLLKPALFELIEPIQSEDYFEPIWMSSTYAVREIYKYFQALNGDTYYYKEGAIDARSPENEADAYERAFLEELNANPELKVRSDIRILDDEPYFVTVHRGETMEEACLRCHSAPDQAPGGLVDYYGSERSFNRQAGDVVSAISIRVPLSAAYAEANRFSLQLSGLLLALLIGLFAAQFWLNKRLLVAPLTRIHDKALQISTSPKHLGEEIPIPAGKELAGLTAAFNTMSIGLRRSRDHLEERVEERAADLTIANKQLEREITERKRAEEGQSKALAKALQATHALQKSEEKRRSLTEDVLGSTAVGIFILDADFQVVWVNQALERYFGLQKEEVIGRDKRQLIRKRIKNIFEEPERFTETVFATYDDNSYVEQFECHVLLGDKRKERWLEHRSQPIRSGLYTGGRVELYYDITERKQAQETLKEYSERLEEMVEERTHELKKAQEQLVRREKLTVLGQMAGSVAHELRNPLGVLSNAAYFLLMTLSDADETTKKYVEMVSSEVRKSEKIVSNLLDFSRTGLVERAEKEEVTLSALVRQVLTEQPPPEQVEVSTRVAPDLPAVFVDPQQIGQVLTNLVTNAYQAMPKGGKLSLNAKVEEGRVTLAMSDTGTGISEENIKKLFEPLFTTKARGIGLGLAVCKNLVEANGGIIKVESEEGQGSTFTITLPGSLSEKDLAGFL